MSHIYSLKAVVNGNNIKINKYFTSRNQAISYMFNYYENNYLYNMQVEEEYEKEKHIVEYVCDYNNRFTVARVA